ncbi:hypothetical protein [Reinekea blandensis]|uniref:Uncharacterized protein n=1 Tax=Reinekea blandensis MED297 TaxID=314283 RepID=A4BG58_9GAMM|nr:hypothetical protein [Reinekea blandensis]EAR08853.1 hypothetical protein MED297_04267 [Reinekea sp. MED297] [Reinekea blandensis MED297]
MPDIHQLKNRLHEIAHQIAQSGHAHALLGLGSAGNEQDRLDTYSDLDFFAIVHPGFKSHFINDLHWLTDIADPGYYFRNTKDGYKFLYADGIFCEFAVFEPQELATIPFTGGRLIWAEDGFNTDVIQPVSTQGQYQRSDNTDWIIGEALTNLYVGLGRYCRGEKLSAMKFVQSYALDRLIDLLHLQNGPRTGQVDPFMPDRRLEQHYPNAEPMLASFCQGYLKTPTSALAQLEWLEQHYDINPVMATEIRRLAD